MQRHLPTVLVIGALLAAYWWVTAPKDDAREGGGLGSTTATVVWVPDGDTLHVDLPNGSRERVRLIAVDAPENSPERVDCGGKESARSLQGLAPKGTKVTLIEDPTQPSRDRFDRLLRYAELTDGADLGEKQIRAGHAEARAYDGNPRRIDEYELAEDEAFDAQRGIWGACR